MYNFSRVWNFEGSFLVFPAFCDTFILSRLTMLELLEW
jgi:hypothetical protein